MADITICTNDECPLRYSCYRHNAPRGEWQSFQKFEPNFKDEKLDEVECRFYISEIETIKNIK